MGKLINDDITDITMKDKRLTKLTLNFLIVNFSGVKDRLSLLWSADCSILENSTSGLLVDSSSEVLSICSKSCIRFFKYSTAKSRSDLEQFDALVCS